VNAVGWIANPMKLPYVANNPDFEIGRHAIAIDQRRAFVRSNLWPGHGPKAGPRDRKQVWFPGVHCDVGGGYPEAESGLSKLALSGCSPRPKPHSSRSTRRKTSYHLATRGEQPSVAFLLYDLAFPVFCYIVVLRFSDRVDHARPTLPSWLVAGPIAVTIVADWIDNLIQLAQLDCYQTGGLKSLAPYRIGVAITATVRKLTCFGASTVRATDSFQRCHKLTMSCLQ
jgi:hypothetical protein